MTHCCTHVEYSDEGTLQQPDQYVTPVMLVVRHTGVSYIQRKRHQEELDGWSNQSRPFPLHPGLDIELIAQKTHSSLKSMNLTLCVCNCIRHFESGGSQMYAVLGYIPNMIDFNKLLPIGHHDIRPNQVCLCCRKKKKNSSVGKS